MEQNWSLPVMSSMSPNMCGAHLDTVDDVCFCKPVLQLFISSGFIILCCDKSVLVVCLGLGTKTQWLSSGKDHDWKYPDLSRNARLNNWVKKCAVFYCKLLQHLVTDTAGISLDVSLKYIQWFCTCKCFSLGSIAVNATTIPSSSCH